MSLGIRAVETGLAERARIGDRAALEQIMRSHNQRLYRLAVSILGDASEAEDVLQESYVRAFLRLGQYSGAASLGGWLAQIVRNEAIDRLRARSVRLAAFTLESDLPDLASIEAASLAGDGRPGSYDPETEASRRETREMLEQVIASLPVQFRTVFMLRSVEGLSVQETAEYLGIPPATVRTRDHRARLLLRERLDEWIGRETREAFAFLGSRCDAVVQGVLARL